MIFGVEFSNIKIKIFKIKLKYKIIFKVIFVIKTLKVSFKRIALKKYIYNFIIFQN